MEPQSLKVRCLAGSQLSFMACAFPIGDVPCREQASLSSDRVSAATFQLMKPEMNLSHLLPGFRFPTALLAHKGFLIEGWDNWWMPDPNFPMWYLCGRQ